MGLGRGQQGRGMGYGGGGGGAGGIYTLYLIYRARKPTSRQQPNKQHDTRQSEDRRETCTEFPSHRLRVETVAWLLSEKTNGAFLRIVCIDRTSHLWQLREVPSLNNLRTGKTQAKVHRQVRVQMLRASVHTIRDTLMCHIHSTEEEKTNKNKNTTRTIVFKRIHYSYLNLTE